MTFWNFLKSKCVFSIEADKFSYHLLVESGNENIRTMREMCLKLTIKTPEWCRPAVFIVNLEQFHTLFWYFHCWLWTSKFCLFHTFFWSFCCWLWTSNCRLRIELWFHRTLVILVEYKLSFIKQFTQFSEAATRGVLWKKVFFEISQNSQENPLCPSLFFQLN